MSLWYRLRNAWEALTAKVDPDYKATHHIEVYFDSDASLEVIQLTIDEIMEFAFVDEVGYFDET